MTQIFKTYSDFLNREYKAVNGVSEEFAKHHPDYEEENRTNKGCWNCSDCSNCSYCSYCSDCSDCYDCSDCSYCSYCSDCSDCYDCSDLQNIKQGKGAESDLKIPIIKDIHQKVLEAIQDNGNRLDMRNWHTCETTHCRAGWVVHLAGKEGYDLEEKTSTEFAAKQIYKASSPIRVSPTRFFEKNDEAMADIIWCAEEERGFEI